jgi:hypothetical protein
MARQRVNASRQNDNAGTQSIKEPTATSPSSRNTTRRHARNGALSPDTRRRIEQLAYEFYEQRGCRHGDDWKDWLEAERLTIAEQKNDGE